MAERTREKTPDITSKTESITFVKDEGGISTSIVFHTENVLEHTEEMTDIVTPQYNQISSAGGIVNNPMTQSKVWIDAPFSKEFSFALTRTDGSTLLTYDWMGKFPVRALLDKYTALPSVSSTITQEAINDAYANVTLTEAQALASLGELPETIATILNLCRGATFIIKRGIRRHKINLGLLKQARRKRKKLEVRRLTKSIANNWLNMRYGLRPLYFEVKQSIDALRALKLRKPRYTARGYATDNNTIVNTDVYDAAHSQSYWIRSVIPGINWIQLEAVHTARRTVETRAGVLFEVSPAAYIPALFGLGEPAEALWELTPFSFIADWFFTIGDSIAALEVGAGLNVLSSWAVSSDTTSRILSGDFAYSDTYGYFHIFDTRSISSEPFTAVSTHVQKERIVNTAPIFLVKFKLNMNQYKWADLASLVYTLRTDIRRYTK